MTFLSAVDVLTGSQAIFDIKFPSLTELVASASRTAEDNWLLNVNRETHPMKV